LNFFNFIRLIKKIINNKTNKTKGTPMMTEFQSLELKHKNLLVSYKKLLGLVQKCIEFNETTRKEYEIHLKHFTEQFESNPSGEVNELEQANTKVVDIDIQVKTELNEILETVKAEPEVLFPDQAFYETVKTEERTVETVVSLESLQVEEKVPLTKSQKVRAKKIAAKKLKESAEETLDSTQMKQKLDEVTINSKNKNNTTEMTKVRNNLCENFSI